MKEDEVLNSPDERAPAQASLAAPARIPEPGRPMRVLDADELRAVVGGPEIQNGSNG